MLIRKLVEIARWKKQLFAGLADIVALWIAAWLAFSIRLGEDTSLSEVQWLFIAVAPLLALPGFIWSGLYRSVIRFVGEQALLFIAKGVTLAALAWLALALFIGELGLITGMPRTVPALYLVMAFAFVAASRFSARWLIWKSQRMRFGGRQALIYGADSQSQELAMMLRQGVEYFPAGFIDGSGKLHSKDIGGLRVYSPRDLPMLISRFEISDVIIPESALQTQSRREIMHLLEPHPVHVRLASNLVNKLSHAINKIALSDLDPLDLLDREPANDQAGDLAHLYQGAVILVTGAAGSIGSEICRRVLAERPKNLVLLDNSEVGLYQIHLELTELLKSAGFSDVTIKPVLADVRDASRIQQLFKTEQPSFVFHAAAYKHVTLIEQNPIEGTEVNVFGTLNCMVASAEVSAAHFVLVSTDKAVKPTSVMGMTKRVGELLVLSDELEAMPKMSQTRFSLVRFGNVLDSSGSVIPLFRRQIAAGGPVTVTHPDVTRYFMTIPQAAGLVLKTPGIAQGKDVFVLEMGPPVKITDIAKRMIRFSGLRVKDEDRRNGDIEISFIGLRPGEKLHEELTYNGNAQGTSVPGILHLPNERNQTLAGLDFQLRALAKYCDEYDTKQVIRAMSTLVSGIEGEVLGIKAR